MRIHVLSTFLDGRDRFEAGDSRTVDNDRATKFIGQGWARAEDGEVVAVEPAGELTLDVQKSFLTTGDSNG
jgi:hypothetical protein